MSQAPGSLSGTKARVLVVDDSRVMRKAIERVLSSEYELIEAGDGEAGWDALKGAQDIRVVISDVQMPILDGYGMICRIRAADDNRVSDIPIIVITGADDEITKERAYACGANDFIAKPIDSSQLLSAVRNHSGSEVQSQTDTAGVDPLTQIATREAFLDAGRRMLAESQKSGDMLSLIRLDVDSFDAMRTAYGDDASDQILVWTSKILLDKIRKQDFIGQLGRSQFAILTASAGRVEAAVLCDRIRAAVSAGPYKHEDKTVPVTLSVGLVTAGHDSAGSLEEMIDLASQRVAVARSRGGNQLIAGDSENSGTVEEAVIEEPDIETALQIVAGLKSGNFDPYAIDLAQRVLPLLEYCDEKFQLSIDREIAAIRARLAGV